MAGYATSANIASEFKDTTFDGSSVVTTTELDEWSELQSRTLDGYLQKKYDVPITAAAALSTCELLVRSWVAARVARILNATTGISEGDLNKAFGLEKFANAWLKDFKKGKVELVGATEKSRLAPKSYNQQNSIDPTWEKGVDQW